MKSTLIINERTGLTEEELGVITSTISLFPEIEKVFIFGSRAKGNYKRGSDIDLAVSGDNVTYSMINQLAYKLNEESLLPYYFDLLHLEKISSEALLEHIKKHGIELEI